MKFAITLRQTRKTFTRIGIGDFVTLKPKSPSTRRVNRIELGNFGDHKFCRDGVWELRIDVGPGYRVYYAIAEPQVVLLLCGGDKRLQNADIERACHYWRDWQRRT